MTKATMDVVAFVVLAKLAPRSPPNAKHSPLHSLSLPAKGYTPNARRYKFFPTFSNTSAGI